MLCQSASWSVNVAGSDVENQRMSMRIDLEVLSSFVFDIITSTSDSEVDSERASRTVRQ